MSISKAVRDVGRKRKGNALGFRLLQLLKQRRDERIELPHLLRHDMSTTSRHALVDVAVLAPIARVITDKLLLDPHNWVPSNVVGSALDVQRDDPDARLVLRRHRRLANLFELVERLKVRLDKFGQVKEARVLLAVHSSGLLDLDSCAEDAAGVRVEPGELETLVPIELAVRLLDLRRLSFESRDGLAAGALVGARTAFLVVESLALAASRRR